MDSKKNYILSCIRCLLNLPEEPKSLQKSTIIDKFLEEDDMQLLVLAYIVGKGFKNYVVGEQLPEGSHLIHIAKTGQARELENPSQILSISLRPKDPLQFLLRTLKGLYSPVLRNIDPVVASNLDDLKVGIESQNKKHITDENDLNFEHTSEQFDFWQEAAINKPTPKSAFISQVYTQVDKRWKSLRDIAIIDVKELAENSWSALEKIWNSEYAYNEKRLAKIVELMCRDIAARLTEEFNGGHLWTLDLESKIKLVEAVDVCRTFQKVGSFYQQQLFKKKVNPLNFKALAEVETKLLTAIRIRMMIEELGKVHRQTPFSNDPAELIHSLEQINLLALQPNQMKPFQEAFDGLKTEVKQLMSQCIPILAKELQQSMQRENCQSVFNCLKKWQNLLREDQSKTELAKELDQAAKLVAAQLTTYDLQFQRQIKEQKPVQQIINLKSLGTRMQRLTELCSELLESAPAYEGLVKAQQQLQNRLDACEKDALKNIKNSLETALKDPQAEPFNRLLGRKTELAFQNNTLQVKTPEETVSFVTDMKELHVMGYVRELPAALWDHFETAKRFYREHNILKQLANTFNSMENRMVECQKSMISKEMEQLDEILRFPKGKKKKETREKDKPIIWDTVEELQSFIDTLSRWQTGLNDVMKKLHNAHSLIEETVLSMLSYPLVPANFGLYSQKLESIERTVELMGQGREAQEWRRYWDHQLAKVIENSWRFAMLQGIKISMVLQLVLNARNVAFRPEICEVKQQYYNELKAFVSWPLRIKGLSSTTEVYSKIADNNSDYLLALYQKSEDLFRRIANLAHDYQQWQLIASLDVDALEDSLNDEQLNSALTALREKKDIVDRIPQEIKLEHITVDMTQFKASLVTMLDQHIDSLIQLIRNQIKKESQEVQAFIVSALEKISKRPANMQEMAVILKEYEKVRAMQQQMAKRVAQIQKKNINIRAMTGASFNTSNMQKRWENFEMASDDFNRVLGEQKNNIKEEVNKRGQAAEAQAEKMISKWQQIKPRGDKLDRQIANGIYARMKDWQSQWIELEAKVATCISDSEHFNMKPPELKGFNRAKQQLDDEIGNWRLFSEYNLELEVLAKQPWLSFRGQLFKYTDLNTKFADKLRSAKREDMVLRYMQQMLESNKQLVQLLKSMNGENFEREHWAYLFVILKVDKSVNSADKLTFGHLIQSDVAGHAQQIRQLQARAKGEVTIRDALAELQVWSDSRQFELSEYSSSGRITPLIKEWKDLMTQVSDHQSLVASLRQSKFAGRFKDEIEQYDVKFASLDQYLLRMNQIQRKWVYLEPIFMRGALPEQQGRWRRLDEDYRNIMLNMDKDRRVMQLCSVAGFKETLDTILDQLERCQKALSDFLEEKRNKFPRFYFIGDDDLLEILGQSQNPAVIQQHLKKLFSGIHTVTLTELPPTIVGMNSSAGEHVKLANVIDVDEIVEKWLDELNLGMVETLKKELDGIHKDRQDMFGKFPSQIICLYNQLTFNLKVEEAIQNSSLARLLSRHQSMLEELTASCHGSSDLTLAKIKSLILDAIHQIDVLNQLLLSKVKETSEWPWFKQLRYSRQGKNVVIDMANATFQYTFEYQGNAPKLVHTPLTDKCYLTLTQAMHMGFGGNPYGPAGTGKTESVKALGQAFARQVLVFNCDEGLDFHSMGRIFTGLVKCGAWGCFDEFNRLLEEQLSAISQQIQVIQEAIKLREKSMNLMGKVIDVNPNSGIFVTLNPAGKGYGGRSKLPDNLKQLFRPVAMSVPDNELIAEVLLFSEGFKTAKVLARKIIAVFTLSKQLLSKQQHYDWGLRALKTILTVAGRLIFEQKELVTPDVESELLIKALRINTLSKLTFVDMNKFVVLIKDVFPGISVKDIVYQQITAAAKKAFEEDKRDLSENQINKILQFYEATKQRIGAVLVGPSGCGKTTIWKTLKRAYEKLGQQVKVHLINPKAMPRKQLLGNMNNDTREFSQGVLTTSAREVIKTEQSVLNWIICDGDIDPEWIESLNSVLDDNHLLTLPTGERISFGSNVNFIFETDNLQYASPATVSRMGMIFLNDEDINIEGIIARWAGQYGNEFTTKNIDKVLQAVNWISQQNELAEVVATTRVGLVRGVLSQLSGVSNEQELNLQLLRGLASNYDNDTRREIYKKLFGRDASDLQNPLGINLSQGKLHPFEDESTSFEVAGRRILMTKQLKRDLAIIKPWFRRGEHFIVVGKEGCGKSILVDAGIAELEKSEKCKVITIHCNRETTGSSIVQKLTQVCQKSSSASGRILKPLSCNRQIIVLKEINLPKPDKYNTIQLVSFLQAVITHNGFYDQSLEFVQIGQGIQFVAIMKPDSTLGRFPITSRFVSNVRVLWVDYDSVGTKEVLMQLTPHWKAVEKKVREIWQNIQANFTADEQRHYLFAPRDLNSLVENLRLYDIDYAKQEDIMGALQYELTRQFADKLVDEQAKSKFEKVFQIGKELFYSIGQNGKLTQSNREQFALSLKGTIDFYEREVKDIKVVMVPEVFALMAGIEKKLLEGGALLLAGSSGNFRRSAVSLMSFKHKFQLLTPLVLRNPTLRDFNKDMKSFLELAGGQNKKVVLFLEDHQLQKSEFLEKINSLISSGEVPGLFTPEEVEHVIQEPEQLRVEYPGKSMYECFVERIRKNMVVVVSLDHRNKSFGQVCSANPAFFSKCRVIWLDCMRAGSLKLYSAQTLTGLPKVDGLSQHMINLHRGSTRTFCQYLETFKAVYAKSLAGKGNKTERLNQGLSKLKEAEDTVDRLTKEAKQKKALLAVKQRQADDALARITTAMQSASQSKVEAQKLKEFLSNEQGKIKGSKDEVEQQLSSVQPMIEAAKKAVGGISKSNIDELRSFMNPPEPVRHVLRAVLYLFGNQDESWNSMKNFVKSCVEKILNFDVKNMKADLRREVENMMVANARSFEQKVIYNSSAAAGPLADWVKAVVQYSKVYEKVAPLQEELDTLERKLESSRKQLAKCTKELSELEVTVKELQEDFARRINEAESLKSDLAKAEQTVSVAQNLLAKLKDEKVRWQTEKRSIDEELQLVPKYSLLTASYITYMSEHPEDMRQRFLVEWKQKLAVPNYNFLRFMSSESALLKQTTLGLPNDLLSLENSQIIFNSSRTVLMMDPDAQASTWLKNCLAGKGPIEVLSQQQPKFTNLLELAIRFGKTLLVQELNSLEPLLVPILKKDLKRFGSRLMLQIGDKQIDFNEQFKLFLTTRNSNIELNPNEKDLVSFVNFPVTRSGLQGKLLSIIIAHEQPELERKKQAYLEREEKLKLSLAEMEEKLLKELAQSTGNILENKTLIESLNETKEKSTVIGHSLEESERLQLKLNEERQVYKPLSQCGAIIFITLGQLKKLSPMYRFSLLQFIQLFEQSLRVQNYKGEKLDYIKARLISIVYNNISVGLLKAHRLVFAIIMSRAILNQEVSDSLYDVLLGNVIVDPKQAVPKWLNPTEKESCQALLSGQIRLDLNNPKWEEWYRLPNCEESFPDKVMSEFTKCLVVQALRPDRLVAALSNFTKNALQLESLAGLPLNFPALTSEIINANLPALFIVSAGFDPSKELQEHADKTIGRDNFKELSMGGNQNDLALEMLKEAAKKGQWLCLKNLHLVVSFLNQLEQEFRALPDRSDKFRLFLTTESHPKFPSILLDGCFKISYEAPPGIKQNLTRIVSAQSSDFSTGDQGKLQFALCYFHALIQERRNYIPQGWTKSYEFNYGDFRAGTNLVIEVTQQSNISWNMLYGLMQDTVYGGRIDNEVDLDMLRVLLLEYFHPEVLAGKRAVFNGLAISSPAEIQKNLPSLDNPLIYGLPFSIDRTVQRFNSNELVNNLKIVTSADAQQLKFSRESWSKLLRPISTLWKGLDKNIADRGLQVDQKQLNSLDPVQSFVYMEASQALTTYRIIKHSFAKLDAVANSNELLTSQIQEEGVKLLTNQVPTKWCKDWEGPELPTTWIKEFAKKIISLKRWVELTRDGGLLKSEIDLSELYHPQIMLNAFKQRTARDAHRPIDQLGIAASFEKPRGNEPYLQLKNIQLQGCSIKNGVLIDGNADLPEFQPLPVLYLSYTAEKHDDTTNTGEFPLYSNVAREKLLAKLRLRIDGKVKTKIIAGVALFLMD